MALALINDLVLFPLASNHDQIALFYAALMIFVRWASLGHFVGVSVSAVKQREMSLIYPGLLTLAVIVFNFYGVLGVLTP